MILSPPANQRVCLVNSEREGKDGFCLPSIKPPTCTNEDWETVSKQYSDIKYNCDHHIQTRGEYTCLLRLARDYQWSLLS